MRLIEDGINYFSDMDWQWYPYVSLRPEKYETMTSATVLKVTLAYAPAIFILAIVTVFLLPIILSSIWLSLIASYLILSMIFFSLMRLIIATAWNSRAHRIRKQKRGVIIA